MNQDIGDRYIEIAAGATVAVPIGPVDGYWQLYANQLCHLAWSYEAGARPCGFTGATPVQEAKLLVPKAACELQITNTAGAGCRVYIANLADAPSPILG